jgi:hypothetical protein
MKYVIAYYLIGFVVSAYHIWYYRFSSKTKGLPQVSDAVGALIGPWVWPLQIIKHIKDRSK